MDYFLYEFTSLRGVTQGKFHAGKNADEHTLRVVEEMDRLIRQRKETGELKQELLLLTTPAPLFSMGVMKAFTILSTIVPSSVPEGISW